MKLLTIVLCFLFLSCDGVIPSTSPELPNTPPPSPVLSRRIIRSKTPALSELSTRSEIFYYKIYILNTKTNKSLRIAEFNENGWTVVTDKWAIEHFLNLNDNDDQDVFKLVFE